MWIIVAFMINFFSIMKISVLRMLMGCLIKMVKNRGAIKNISFIHFERVAKRDNKYIDSERDKIKNK